MKKHLGLTSDYAIEGFIEYGTYSKYPYEMIKARLAALGYEPVYQPLPGFLEAVLEFTVNSKKYWFVVAYGGALLSEWTHLACMFGSKANVVLGSCGGLLEGAETRDIIIPNFSYGDESTTRSYQPDTKNIHQADYELRQKLTKQLREHKVWEGPSITHQAMLGETWADVQQWASEGYYGVEMEVATVFAVSNHFKVPAAAALMIGDNLIKEETVLDVNYEEARGMRRKVTTSLFDAALNVVVGEPQLGR